MLPLKKILAGSLIAYGTGVILWIAQSFTQALITEHIRVDLTIHSYALAILLVFFGASSVAIGVWYQRHHQWVFRVVMAVVAALIIAMVYAMVYAMEMLAGNYANASQHSHPNNRTDCC